MDGCYGYLPDNGILRQGAVYGLPEVVPADDKAEDALIIPGTDHGPAGGIDGPVAIECGVKSNADFASAVDQW